uniref:Aspartic peptidase N-terminal domain-containing protein n=1 Tax=Anas platyrhynchos platyrhynchos TaxID=8840 RepID=A0A493T731_ANAPP
MKWLVLAVLCLQLSEGVVRIQLRKYKSARELMREAGVLKDYLKKMKHDPARRYHFGRSYLVHEPMASHLDVSTGPPSLPAVGASCLPVASWCSSTPAPP